MPPRCARQSSTQQHPAVALRPPGAHHHVRRARGGPPVDGADVVAVDVLPQRVELGALAAHHHRGATVQLAQPGQPGRQVPPGGERRQHPDPPRDLVRALPGGQPERADGAHRDAAGRPVAAAGGQQRRRHPPPLARAGRRRRCRVRGGARADGGHASRSRPRTRRTDGFATVSAHLRRLAQPDRGVAGAGQPQRGAPARRAPTSSATSASSAPVTSSTPSPDGSSSRHHRGARQREQPGPPGQRHRVSGGPGRRRARPSSTRVRRHALQLGLGPQLDPVPQRRPGQRLDVVRRHVVAAGQPGPGPGRRQQRGGSRAARRRAAARASRGWRGPGRRRSPTTSGASVTPRTAARPAARSATPATGRTPAAARSRGSKPSACRVSTCTSSSRGGQRHRRA